jgi:hypothetical protein
VLATSVCGATGVDSRASPLLQQFLKARKTLNVQIPMPEAWERRRPAGSSSTPAAEVVPVLDDDPNAFLFHQHTGAVADVQLDSDARTAQRAAARSGG